MKNLQGKRSSIYRSSLRHGYAVWFALGATLACGVVEHVQPGNAVDTTHDFDPTPTGGSQTLPPVGSAGTLATTAGAAGAAGSASSAGTAPIMVGGSGGAGGSGGVASAGVSSVGGASGGSVASAGSGGGAGGPLSGVTINLGGTNVPMEHVIGFIHIGHSNMAGRATVPAASRAYHFQQTDPHAWMYHPGSPPALAIEPKTAGDDLSIQEAGPGTALVKQAAALAPNYYFMSLGFAVPSAYCSQFIPGGLYYDQLIAGPKAIKGKITFGAIFIYLGITERHGSAADRNGFSQCINTLVTNIRKDVGVPDLPVVMNNYEVEATGELAVGSAEYNAIYPQIQMCPTVVSSLVLVPCDGLGMEDDHHFNLDGQFTWVQRAMTTMQTKGWFKWH